MEIIGYVFTGIGVIFLFLGVLGVIRMPDVYNKLQAGTKATTLGFLSMIAGAVFFRPEWWSKLLALGLFILVTAPIGSHNLARAAHSSREKIRIDGHDALEEEDTP